MMMHLPILPPESCEGCGLCCEGIGSPVLLYASRPGMPSVHPFRPTDLPKDCIDEIDLHFSGLARGQEPQERCLWFDEVNRVCRHYAFRPQVCRDYELGGRACLQRRHEEAMRQRPDNVGDDPLDAMDGAPLAARERYGQGHHDRDGQLPFRKDLDQ